jgi:DNA-binding MarR family transcriptional regulator
MIAIMNYFKNGIRWMFRNENEMLIKKPKSLNPKERLSICKLYASHGFKVMDLSRQFNVHESTIRRILKKGCGYESKVKGISPSRKRNCENV